MRSKIHSLSAIILLLSAFHVSIGSVLLARVSLILSVIIGVALAGVSLWHFCRGRRVMYMVIGFFVATLLLWVEARGVQDMAEHAACFKFAVSYPGTRKYTECAQSLTLSDYLSL